MADKIKLRRDTQANWEAVNPILDEGELGWIKDKEGFVVGNGVTAFKDLQKHAIFDSDINIYVGPGGDFATHNDALKYIEYLQPTIIPKFNFAHINSEDKEVGYNINLIFKEGYIFTNTMLFENRYMPWLHITQENLNIPLSFNLAETPPSPKLPYFVIYLKNSSIGSINLNLIGEPEPPVSGGIAMQNSSISKIEFEINKAVYGIMCQGRSYCNIDKLICSRLTDSGLYTAYHSYTMLTGGSPSFPRPYHFTDLGITYTPKESDQANSGIRVNQANLRIYNSDDFIVDGAYAGIQLQEGAFANIGPLGSIQLIDNVICGFKLERYSILSLQGNPTFGTNVSYEIYPTSLIPNSTSDIKHGIVIEEWLT